MASTSARWLALLLGVLLLAGCGGNKKPPPEPPKPSKLEMAVMAAPELNPDATGRASPLVVRIYALRSLTEFEKADFFALYEKDEQILAADLSKRDELVLKPGDSLLQPREYAPDVRFIAVMAAFRDVSRASWRASVPLPEESKGALIIKATSNAISVAVEDAVEKKTKD